jgi:acetylornithine deacetylase/succinyl-diaminopimelate desuccinylase-like protein
MKVAAENIGVARFIADDPLTMLKMQRYSTVFNLDGIWGGNMYAGGSGAILPNKITSKHSIRYLPNMHSADILRKIRAQLDRNGYKDVEIHMVGDQPWSKMSRAPERSTGWPVPRSPLPRFSTTSRRRRVRRRRQAAHRD